MTCSVGRSTQKYKNNTASTLQDVTENGNTTTLTIQTSSYFIGDGSLLTNISAQDVRITYIIDDLVSNSARISNLETSNLAIWSNHRSNVTRIDNLVSNLNDNSGRISVLTTDLISNALRITNLENDTGVTDVASNAGRISNLETSNLAIWSNHRSNVTRIINLETSNLAIWSNHRSNVTRITNLETSNNAIWSNHRSNVTRIENLITNLNDNSTRITTTKNDLSSNISRITNLETSNNAIWSNHRSNVTRIENLITNLNDNSVRITATNNDLSSNVSRITNLVETNPLISNSSGITGGFSQGDIIYAIGNEVLSNLGIGSTNKILKSSGIVPYWSDANFTVTNNYTYINAISNWVQRGNDIDGASASQSGTSVALSSYGNILAVGEPGTGSVKLYKWNVNTWDNYGSFSDSSSNKTGTSVSLSGDGTILAIGTPGTSSTTGYVKVYQWVSGTTWSQLGSTITGTGNGLRFGISISLSYDGDILAIGEPGQDYVIDGLSNDVGKVKVYSWNSSSWSQIGSDITGGQGELTGFSVSLSWDGNIVAIGEPRNNTVYRGGRVRIFENNSSVWSAKGTNPVYGFNEGDQFGYAVNLSGDGNVLAVGTPFNDRNGIQSGHAKIYRWNTQNWVQKGVDINGVLIGDQFGNSIALSYDGNYVIIGSLLSDEQYVDAGQIKVFKWVGTIWEQLGYSINGEAAGDNSGTSVAISSDGLKIAIGAPYNNSQAGHVRAFINEVTSTDVNYDQEIIQLNSDIEDLRISNINNNINLNFLDIRISSLETYTTDIYNKLYSNADRITNLENNDIIRYSSGINSGFATGDIIVATGTNSLGVLSVGTAGQVLKTTGSSLYWGEDATGSGATTTSTLQAVTDSGNETNVTVRFLNDNSSIEASGNVTVSGIVEASFFLGDGGLLSNTATVTTPTLQAVTNQSNITSNTVEFTNIGNSIVASGKIIANSFEGDGVGLSGVALKADLTNNVTRITNLETSQIISNSSSLTGGFLQGDLLYADNDNSLSNISVGAQGTVLTVNNGLPEWAQPITFNNYHENGVNTGISNTIPQHTLSVGSNVYIQDTGSDVLYVNGNVYIRGDIFSLGTITSRILRCQQSFVKSTTIIADRNTSLRITP